MAAELFADAAASTLSAAIVSTARPISFTVVSAVTFPATGDFRVKIDSEILTITTVAGTTFTGSNVENTTAATHLSSAPVTHVLTSASLVKAVTDRTDVTIAPEANGSDDTTALNAVFLTNTTVELRPGTYIFTTLTIPSGCAVFGARGRRSTLQAKAGTITDQHVRRVLLSGPDSVLSGCVLDGNQSNLALGTTTLNGALTNVATTVVVNSFANFPGTNGYLIYIDAEWMLVTAGAGTLSWTVTRAQSNTVAVSHLTAATATYSPSDPGSDGFVTFDTGSNRSKLLDCYIKGAPVTGVFGFQTNDVEVRDCRIEDSRWSAIFFRDTCNNCRILYNRIVRPGNGIKVQSLKGIGFARVGTTTTCSAPLIHGNFIDFDTITTSSVWDLLAIEVFGSPRAIITDNVIWGPTTGNSSVYGVSLAGTSPQALAMGNQIRRNIVLGVEGADDSYGCRYIGNSIYDFATGVSISTSIGSRSDDHIVSGNYFESGAAHGNITADAVSAVILNGDVKRAIISNNSFVDFGASGVVLLGDNVQDISIVNNLFVVKYQNGAFGNSSLRGVYIQSGSGHIVSNNEFGPGIPKTGDTPGTGAICAVYILGSALIEKCIISNNKINGRNPANNASIADAIQFEGQVDNTLVMGNIVENTSRSFAFQWSTLGTNPNIFKNNYILSTVTTPYYQGMKSADLIEQVETSMVTGQRQAVQQRDEFSHGLITGTGIGELGWTVGIGGTSAGTHSYVDGTSGHPGIFQLATPTTNSSRNYLHLMVVAAAGNVLASDFFDMLFMIKLTQTDTDTVFRCGLGNSSEADPPVGGCYVEKLLADTSWFGVTRAASSQTRTAALFTSDMAWNRIRVRRKSSTEIGFTINALAEVILTATIPSTALQPFVMIGNNLATTSKSLQVDAVEFNVLYLAR